MKLPKNCILEVKFKYNDVWYQIVRVDNKHSLYRVDVNNSQWTTTKNEYTLLSTSTSPVKLQEKVYKNEVK